VDASLGVYPARTGRFVADHAVKCKMKVEKVREISVKVWFVVVVAAVQWES
jgi:hypothetical protein